MVCGFIGSRKKDFRANDLLVRVTPKQLGLGINICGVALISAVAYLINHFFNVGLETFQESPAHSLLLESFQRF